MVSMSSERASPTSGESGAVVESLRALASDVELAKVSKRLAVDEEALGLRMGDLFAVARTHRDLPLADVEALLDHPAYEPRLAAFCILDFRARRRLEEDQRRELYEIYLRRHDRITTWDMVDRSAPRVVGGYLAGRSLEPLFELAAAAEPLRRSGGRRVQRRRYLLQARRHPRSGRAARLPQHLRRGDASTGLGPGCREAQSGRAQPLPLARLTA